MWKQLNENMKCHQVQRQSSQRVTRGEQISEEKTKKSPSNCTQTAWSFFQTCVSGGVVYLCFCFGFRSRGRQWWREGSGNVPPGSPPHPRPLWALPWSNRTESPDVLGMKASTVAFQASLPWWPEAGAWGLLSPDSMRQEAWGLELSCVPTYSLLQQWRPGGLWGILSLAQC